MKQRILLAAGILYLVVSNLIWIARDNRPPFWDMAARQVEALRIYGAVHEHGVAGLAQIASLTQPYPPLYQTIVSLFYALLGKSSHAAAYANIPAMFLLILSTYGIGRLLLEPLAAAFAGILVCFYPYVAWLSRESLIDFWLTALVALAIYALLRTSEFSNLKWSVAFGVIAGLGMLTKWTFVFFIGLPVVWCARKDWKIAGIAAAIAGAIAGPWYLRAVPELVQLLGVNSAQSIGEGDPPRWTWQAFIFYVRALEGYQIFLPLFVMFLIGAIILIRRFDISWIPIVLWIAGGWIALMLFQNKDPRYSVPLLPAVALITAKIVERRQRLVVPLMALLFFQHYLVSFGIRRLPQTIVVAKGLEGPLSWNWNLYTQQYVDLWGPPAKQDWRIQYVLGKISHDRGVMPVRLGLIPDIPRFDLWAFRFYSVLDDSGVDVDPIPFESAPLLLQMDYLLLSESDQGPVYSSPTGGRVNPVILSRPDFFEPIDRFSLPNGDVIRLYKVKHS